jgi:anti-sigma28 factor (negative regulator of flagellin synthesis)
MRIDITSLLLTLPLGCSVVDGFAGAKSASFFFTARSSDSFPSQSLFAHESEFEDLFQESLNPIRKTRLAREESLSQRFATGEELRNLKSDLETLRHNLQWAEALQDESRVESLRKAIKNGENRVPDIMYAKSLRLIFQSKKMKDASKEEKDALVEKWVKIAAAARECLPQFNLEGLWVGK